ncbi:MAG: WG repeat-containing protein, partial [Sphingobacteriia bacterium]
MSYPRLLICLALLAGLLPGCKPHPPENSQAETPGGWAYPSLSWKNGNAHWKLADRQGHLYRADLPASIHYLGVAQEGWAVYSQGGRYGYLNVRPGGPIMPAQYLYAKPFSAGYGVVLDTLGRWGYADSTGRHWPLEGLHYAGPFSGGAAIALDEQGYRLINPEILTGAQPSLRLPYTRVYDYYNGWAVVEQQGRFGYIDQRGRLRLPPQYEGVTGFAEGYAYVQLPAGWARIDTQGTPVESVRYTQVYG